MPEMNVEPDLHEENIFFSDVPDDKLESAGCPEAEPIMAFTLAMCTGNQECPF